MMNVKKYKLLADDTKLVFGRTLYRIQALRNVSDDVVEGDLGGYIEKEANLSQKGECWVYDEAEVYEDAVVAGDASVCHGAKVSGYAVIADTAYVSDSARVYGSAKVCGNADVFGSCWVYDNAVVDEEAFLDGEVIVSGNTKIIGHSRIEGKVEFRGLDNVAERDALVTADCCFNGNAHLTKETDYMTIKGIGQTAEFATFYKTKTGAAVSYDGNVYTLDEFNDMLDKWDVPYESTEEMQAVFIKEMQVALILAKLHFLHNVVCKEEAD